MLIAQEARFSKSRKGCILFAPRRAMRPAGGGFRVKKALLILAICGGVAGLWRPASGATTRMGIKGGLSLSRWAVNLPGLASGPLETLPWPAGGLFLKLSTGAFSVQAEALYVRAGTRTDVSGVEHQYRIDYVRVPVLVKVNLRPYGSIEPVIYGGTYAAARLTAKEVTRSTDGNEVTDIKSGLKSWDLGLIAGVGVDFNWGMTLISLEARYAWGLLDINTTLVEAPSGFHIRNRTALIMLGVGF
jgi:hypothetical protein